MKQALSCLALLLYAVTGAAQTDPYEGKMKPSGKRCAWLGEYCSVPEPALVRIGGCKSTDYLNGKCSTSTAVEVTGGIRCELQNFDMKAPFPDVGRNGCWWEPVTSRDYVPEKKKAAVSAPVAGVTAITGANCESTGIVTVENTITVAGSSYDGKCKTFLAGAGLKHAGSDRSLDKPIFNVTNGATLRNAIIGDKQNDSGAGGVHVTNGGTIDNVTWVKAPVSAMTIHPTKAKVIVRNLTAQEGAEQFVLINGEADVNISNCIVAKGKRFASQKAGSSAKVVLVVDRCKLDELKEGVFRSDSQVSEAAISNSKLNKTGELCMGKWASCGETVTKAKP